MEKFQLPNLPYGYKDLEPYISEEQLRLHHEKHHAAYVKAANVLLNKIDEARESPIDGVESDYKSISKALSFNIGGHVLHEIFWTIMSPPKSDKNEPKGAIIEAIDAEFGSLARFKEEFSETAKTVEGSGWAVLALDKEHENRLSIIQMEKHNVNLYPGQKILLCLDVWEHAYYVDYRNDRAKFIENWWHLVNWKEVEKRFSER